MDAVPFIMAAVTADLAQRVINQTLYPCDLLPVTQSYVSNRSDS